MQFGRKTFLWGSATSAHQIEGYNVNSDWWQWERAGHIAGGAISGPATDHWNRRSEDLDLASSLGMNTYRFSVEWAKCEPQEGVWHEETFDWYEKLLDDCEKKNLLPMLTLHHFTLPDWFARKGGFTCADSPRLFARFAQKIIDRFGARVPLWCIFNEPMVLALGSYVGGFMPPALHEPASVSMASANMLRAHVLVYDRIHEIQRRSGPFREHPLMVGIAHNMLDFLADAWWHPMENLLAHVAHRFYNLSWLDAITGKKQHFGILGLLPRAGQVKEAVGRVTTDFIGVNYYTKAYLRWRPKDSSAETLTQMPIGVAFARRLEEQSDLGWAFHPEGFRKSLERAAVYGLPIYVTENGLADREDRLRGKYLLAHLCEVAKCIEKGMDIRGFYYWSLLDNFEWVKGFAPRFGLYGVDYETFQRTPRASAALYHKIIAAHAGGGPRVAVISTIDRNH